MYIWRFLGLAWSGLYKGELESGCITFSAYILELLPWFLYCPLHDGEQTIIAQGSSHIM